MQELAAALGVTPRTVRNYCERGLIPEARRKRGSKHWRIRRPLSSDTWTYLKSFVRPAAKPKTVPPEGRQRTQRVCRVCGGKVERIEEDVLRILTYAARRYADAPLEVAVFGALYDMGRAAQHQGKKGDYSKAETHFQAMTEKGVRNLDDRTLRLYVAAETIARANRRLPTVEAIAKELQVHKSTLYRHHGGGAALRKKLARFFYRGDAAGATRPQNLPARPRKTVSSESADTDSR